MRTQRGPQLAVRSYHRVARVEKEFAIMKAFDDGLGHLGLKTDFQRGAVFAAVSIVIFGVLILAERPHWAEPWLLASLFTFAVWRLSRQQSR